MYFKNKIYTLTLILSSLQVLLVFYWIYVTKYFFYIFSSPAQIVKVLIALAVFCTFGLQFYVCLEIGWDAIKANFPNRPTLANYTMRTVLVMSAVLLAVAVPTISPFIGLIGAFCFSVLGLLCPVFIEMVTYWDEGFGPCNWIIWKNVVVCAFGVMALIFGSRSAILEILKLYTDDPESPLVAAVNATAI